MTTFEDERGRLFGLAYRLLGSAVDAEDVLQDAFLRWHAAKGVRQAGPWLTKTVTNLCLNRLSSAWARRVRPEEELPEPVLTAADPLETVALRESVSLALLAVLQRLTPAERAVFVLREAFGYEYPEVAGLLEVSEANARQLHSRAKRRVAVDENRFAATDSAHLAESFLAAARSGDLGALEKLLTEDVRTWMDAGPGRRRRTSGRGDVPVEVLARFVTEHRVAEVNGTTALLFLNDGKLLGVTTVLARDGRIAALYTVADPAKLAYAQRQLAS
ncbi:sigma-70 family RNA polymerase sigma factor [Amycolatopsis acidicola]|uniref:sigma-70 family RNA polymerase sigma factor n=1 Tax=Amycolatopsis acidicola TaxID=2596893 RepID=UPI001FB82B49|nr:sigma-70 family RNA polymerase sigma factor [Amycolatopsis acidicola]